MINLFELSKKQIYGLTIAAVAVGIAFIAAFTVVAANELDGVSAQLKAADSAEGALNDLIKTPEQPADEPEPTAVATTTPTSDSENNVNVPLRREYNVQPQAVPATPAQPNGKGEPATPATPAKPAAPAKQPQGGHIACTNKPVTPGDPLSYVGTVCQCPFYEMAGEKGCTPPPDITCNADWSNCQYKG